MSDIDLVQFEQAIRSCGFSWRAVTVWESRWFPDVGAEDFGSVNVTMYLFVRNVILSEWVRDPGTELTVSRALAEVQKVWQSPSWGAAFEAPVSSPPRALVHLVWTFLDRFGHINVGPRYCVPVPPVHPHWSRWHGSGPWPAMAHPLAAAATPLRIVVLGAGIAGICAAKQLTRWGHSVIVLEAKGRVGGRMHSDTLEKASFRDGSDGTGDVTGVGVVDHSVLKRECFSVPDVTVASKCPCVRPHVDLGAMVTLGVATDGIGFANPLFTMMRAEGLLPQATVNAAPTIVPRMGSKALAAAAAAGPAAEAVYQLARPSAPPTLRSPFWAKAVVKTAMDRHTVADTLRHVSESSAAIKWAEMKRDVQAAISKLFDTAQILVLERRRDGSSEPSVPRTDEPLGPIVWSVLCRAIRAAHAERDAGSDATENHEALTAFVSPFATSVAGDIVGSDDNEAKLAAAARDPALPFSAADILRYVCWFIANTEYGNCTSMDNISYLQWDQDDNYEFGGDHSLVPGGMGLLAESSAETASALGALILLRSPVLSVTRGSSCTCADGVSKRCPVSVSVDVRLSRPLLGNWDEIDKDDDLYMAADDGSPVERNICADAVVVCVPLGVLKASVELQDTAAVNDESPSHQDGAGAVRSPVALPHGAIRFDRLPDAKVAAIQRLGFGALEKTIVEFDVPFWRHHGNAHTSATYYGIVWPPNVPRLYRGLFYHVWDVSPIGGRPVLLGLTAGDAVALHHAASDEQVVNAFVSCVRSVFGGPEAVTAQVISAGVTRWAADPYVQGSYSFIPPGADGSDYDTIAAPAWPISVDGLPRHHTLYFAGESANRRWPASVPGAAISGLHTAAAIVSVLAPLGRLKGVMPAQTAAVSRAPVNQQAGREPTEDEMLAVRQRAREHLKSEFGAHAITSMPPSRIPASILGKRPAGVVTAVSRTVPRQGDLISMFLGPVEAALEAKLSRSNLRLKSSEGMPTLAYAIASAIVGRDPTFFATLPPSLHRRVADRHVDDYIRTASRKHGVNLPIVSPPIVSPPSSVPAAYDQYAQPPFGQYPQPVYGQTAYVQPLQEHPYHAGGMQPAQYTQPSNPYAAPQGM